MKLVYYVIISTLELPHLLTVCPQNAEAPDHWLINPAIDSSRQLIYLEVLRRGAVGSSFLLRARVSESI